MSFNKLLVDQPEPEIAGSAVVLGEVHVGAGAILAQGLVVRAHGAAVSIGNYSAILENGVVIGTPAHPVRVGQRTVFGHRATIVGATVGDLCEIGNGAILMPGSRPGRSWSGAHRTSSGRPPTPTVTGWRCCASIRPA
jgi:carbonic anhydrase/acetyltransferase-like protein (isoleucine patch superfamily)